MWLVFGGLLFAPLPAHVLNTRNTSVQNSVLKQSNQLPEQPFTNNQMHSFLGFTCYLCDFIPMFAQLVQLLTALQYIKHIQIHWNQACQ
ncbi:hypothetical protein QOT17_015915, partial [Balamuthia mandrillaris]